MSITTVPEVPHFNRYVKPTVELVLRLLAEAYEDQHKLDRVLKEISDEVFAELAKEIQKLVDDGKIDFDKKIDLYNNPALLTALKQIETK
jgi:hypothetical protein